MARRQFLKKIGAATVAVGSSALELYPNNTIQPQATEQFKALVQPNSLAAVARYLSPQGNDSDDGTENAPWRNLSFAITKLSPGDTLICQGAFTLSGSPFRHAATTRAGLPDQPITIMANSPGAASFDGSATIGHFLTLNHPYWVIQALEITHFNLNGIQINANFCVIRQCIIHDYQLDPILFPKSSTTVGVHLKKGASNCIVEDNVIYNSPNSEAIYLGENDSGRASRDNIVRRNRISNVWEGIDVKRGSTPNTIEANTIDNCGHFGINSPDGITIQHNTVIRSGRSGTKAGISVKGDSVVQYNTVIHCPNSGIRIENSNNIVEANLVVGTGVTAIDNRGNKKNRIQQNIILS
jgi:hypothetical protein